MGLLEQEREYDVDIPEEDNNFKVLVRRRPDARMARKSTAARGDDEACFQGRVLMKESVNNDKTAKVTKKHGNHLDNEYTHDTSQGYDADDKADGGKRIS
jgi:hypothetical protein